MNWLAHIFLSESNIEFQIGNYLADPLKGKAWEDASLDIKKGIQIHKLIDSYTDRHEKFKQSKQRLGKKGLLKAVVIDLTYDYLLTKNWQSFSSISIDEFLQTFYKEAKQTLPLLPKHASTPLQRMIEFDLLNKYQNLQHLNDAFKRVDRRLSPRLKQRDLVSNYFEKVCDNIDEIENDFLLFFPQLCNEVKKNTDKTKLSHWRF